MPVRMDSLVIDLNHPLGPSAAALTILSGFVLSHRSGFIFDAAYDKRAIADMLQHHCEEE